MIVLVGGEKGGTGVKTKRNS